MQFGLLLQFVVITLLLISKYFNEKINMNECIFSQPSVWVINITHLSYIFNYILL